MDTSTPMFRSGPPPAWHLSAAERFEEEEVSRCPMLMRMRVLNLAFLASLALAFATPVQAQDDRNTSYITFANIIAEIKRADYSGDRPALKRLYGELTPFIEDHKLASRVRYWRGFALWRRALNGFNDSTAPKELEEDLNAAVDEFNASEAKDRSFVDAKVAALSCLSNLIFLNQKKPSRMQELIAQASPLSKEAKAEDPNNPRLLWVLGPILWNAPPERSGGQDKAIETSLKGLEEARKRRGEVKSSLDPSWGEPELLTALAWENLNRSTPDLTAAEEYARSALALVPYWHYVRDILMQEIRDAKAKRKQAVH